MSFYTEFLQHAPLFNSTVRVSSLDYLAPVFRAKVMDLMEAAAALGHPVYAFETYRSAEHQHALYLQGTTQLSTVGCHHFGVACDLVKSNTENPWEGDFSFLGKLANQHGLVWGGVGTGNLNIGDNDHLQWCKFSDQGRLFSGNWFPEDEYVAWSPVIA